MKKIYKKPYIVVESFQLDAAIASSCSHSNRLPIHYGENTCTPFEEAPGLLYLGLACATNGGYDLVSDLDGSDGFCYHGPIPELDLSQMFLKS